MLQNSLDIEKAKAVVLYITRNTHKPTLHKIFKILYFAEQKHLVKYGTTILKDRYIAMKDGPVPSDIYNLLKDIRDNRQLKESAKSFYDAFTLYEGHKVTANETPSLKYLSKSDIECLNASIEENDKLSYDERTAKSHDFAWKSANKNDEIDFGDIAKAGGANNDMLAYIGECLDTRNIYFA